MAKDHTSKEDYTNKEDPFQSDTPTVYDPENVVWTDPETESTIPTSEPDPFKNPTEFPYSLILADGSQVGAENNVTTHHANSSGVIIPVSASYPNVKE